MFFIKIPLSFVIKHTTQILFPSLQLRRFIKPVFCQHRKNVKLHDGTHPICGASTFFSAAEVTVTNSKASAQRLVFRDFLIQNFYLVNQSIKGFICKSALVILETF